MSLVGGSGWEVATWEGRTEKYYVALPPDIGAAITSTLVFPDAPSEHRGQPLTDKSVATLGRLYLDYLDELFGEASSMPFAVLFFPLGFLMGLVA